MLTKTCTKCFTEKEIKLFYPKESGKFGFDSVCRNCKDKINKIYYQSHKEQNTLSVIKYQKNFPWRIVHRNLNSRCNNPKDISYSTYGERGIQNLFKNSDEVKSLWFRDNAYLMKRPSIDRINNNGNYCLENCRFIELKENISRNQTKPILQYDLNNIFIKEWNSISEACEYFHTSVSNISSVLRKTSKSACGHLWRYKNE